MPKPTIGQSNWGGPLNDYLDTLGRKDRIDARDYGDLSSDTADDTANVATLQAAATAANALGGADVQVPNMVIPINAAVTFPEAAGLVGAGRSATQFLATHADAKLTFDAPSFAKISNWKFDGDGIATHGVQVLGASNGMHMSDVFVDNCERGMSMHNVQNAQVDRLVIQNCHRGLDVVDGCGSVVFNALSIANFTVDSDTEYGLYLGEEGVEVSGYNEPTALVFVAPMIEVEVDAGAGRGAVVIEGASRVKFINPNIISARDAWALTLDLTAPATEGSILVEGGYIAGNGSTTPLMRISDGAVTFVGQNILNAGLSGLTLDAGGRLYGSTPTIEGCATELAFTGGATWNGNMVRREERGRFIFRAEDGSIPTVMLGKGNENGYRTYLYGDGRLGIANTDAFGADVEIQTGGDLGVMKISDNGILKQGSHATLPVAGLSARRGGIVIVPGGAGVADTIHVCIKDAADAYVWKTITLA